MISLPYLLKIKFPDISFGDDVCLSDSTNGPIISYWGRNEPLPTQQDLENWSKECDLMYRQIKAIEKRIYPPIGEQLDMIYNDKINNTTNWVDLITYIKQSHPKPNE